jgi:hypothetical protein
MSPRTRSWVWISVVVILGTIGAGVVGWRIVRATWSRLLPGATLVLTIDSAHPFDERRSPDEARSRTLDVLRGRLEKVSPTALAAVHGDRVEVLLPRGASPEWIARLLTRTGRLEFKLVDDGSEYMKPRRRDRS